MISIVPAGNRWRLACVHGNVAKERDLSQTTSVTITVSACTQVLLEICVLLREMEDTVAFKRSCLYLHSAFHNS